MANKQADQKNFSINTKGRGGGYERNKDGAKHQSDKKYSLKEPCNEKDDFWLFTYNVHQGTENNLVTILDSIPIKGETVEKVVENHCWEDVLLFDGMNIGNTKFNTFTSDDDPEKGINCPVVKLFRTHPDCKAMYCKPPQYGLIFSCIDHNEYEAKRGKNKGEFFSCRRKPLFITERFLYTWLRDIVKQCFKNNVDNLKGTTWSIDRGWNDSDKGIFTPKIGDRWNFDSALTEKQMFDEFDNAAVDFGWDNVEDYCYPIDYESVLQVLPFDEREEIAARILEASGVSRSSNTRSGVRGNRSNRGRNRGRRSNDRGRGPRSARSSRGNSSRSEENSSDSENKENQEPRRPRREARHKRTEDYSKDEPESQENPPAKNVDNYFPPADDDDVPF